MPAGTAAPTAVKLCSAMSLLAQATLCRARHGCRRALELGPVMQYANEYSRLLCQFLNALAALVMSPELGIKPIS